MTATPSATLGRFAPMLDREEVGRRITSLRDKARMTQPEVATQLGVSLRQYQRWESGDSLPYWRNLQRLAEIFSVDLDQILGDAQPDGLSEQLDRLEEMIRNNQLLLQQTLELLKKRG